MARLIYSAISSLDGYIADADGSFDWAMPDEEVHSFINNLERAAGTLRVKHFAKRGFEFSLLPSIFHVRPSAMLRERRPLGCLSNHVVKFIISL